MKIIGARRGDVLFLLQHAVLFICCLIVFGIVVAAPDASGNGNVLLYGLFLSLMRHVRLAQWLCYLGLIMVLNIDLL